VQRFVKQVRETTSLEVNDRFIDIVLDSQHGYTNTLEFKQQLSALLQAYP